MPFLCGQGDVHRHSQLMRRRSALEKIVVIDWACARAVILALPAPLGFLFGLSHIAILAFLAQRGLLLFNDGLNQRVQTLRILFVALAPRLPRVTSDPRILRVTCLHSSQLKETRNAVEVTYHVAELLVESVTSPTARLLVRNLGSDPIAEVLLVFFIKLCSPAKHDVNLRISTGENA